MNRKTEKIGKTKLVLEKISKIDKPLALLTKKKKKRTQVTNIRNERWGINTDLTEIKKRGYHEQMYSNKRITDEMNS